MHKPIRKTHKRKNVFLPFFTDLYTGRKIEQRRTWFIYVCLSMYTVGIYNTKHKIAPIFAIYKLALNIPSLYQYICLLKRKIFSILIHIYMCIYIHSLMAKCPFLCVWFSFFLSSLFAFKYQTNINNLFIKFLSKLYKNK